MSSLIVKSPLKVTGHAKGVKLQRLSKTVFKNHRAAMLDHDKWLTHVYAVGEALLEAKRVLGGRGNWGKWLAHQREFAKKRGYKFSQRTARAYMQVVKKWDEPLVKEAREKGEITSINALLDPGPPKSDSSQDGATFQAKPTTDADQLRTELRKMFNEDLNKNYKLDELDAFHTDFYSIAQIYRDEVRQRVLQREQERQGDDAFDRTEPPEQHPTKKQERKSAKQWEKALRRIKKANSAWATVKDH